MLRWMGRKPIYKKMSKFQSLGEFVDIAVKNRKYQEATAQGLKAALKLFDAELNENEKNSLELFEKNIEQIFKTVSAKNNKKFTAASLATYKSRVIKVINDYKKYGIDTAKMANWEPKVVSRAKKHSAIESSASKAIVEDPDGIDIDSNKMHRIDLSLRPDAKVLIVVPRDITPGECKMIKAILDSFVIANSENAES